MYIYVCLYANWFVNVCCVWVSVCICVAVDMGYYVYVWVRVCMCIKFLQ